MYIIPGYSLRDGIHKAPCVGQGNHAIFVLLVGVHTPPWLPVRRCAHFEPCT